MGVCSNSCYVCKHKWDWGGGGALVCTYVDCLKIGHMERQEMETANKNQKWKMETGIQATYLTLGLGSPNKHASLPNTSTSYLTP